MSIFEILNLRTQWEQLVEDFKMNEKEGTIYNIKWFINNGHENNRFRNGFNEAMEIARIIDKNT